MQYLDIVVQPVNQRLHATRDMVVTTELFAAPHNSVRAPNRDLLQCRNLDFADMTIEHHG